MKNVPLSVRSSEAERSAWEAAAGYEPISAWARRVLNEAAGIAHGIALMENIDVIMEEKARRGDEG